MNDYDLVRSAMRAADPVASSTDQGPVLMAVPPLGELDEPFVGAGRRRYETGTGVKRSWAIAAAAAVAVVALAVVALVPIVGTGDSAPVGSGVGPTVAEWCGIEPLVSDPASDSPSDLRLYHTAQLAWALTALEVAPAEVRNDMAVLAAEVRRVHDALEAAAWEADGVERSLSPEARAAQAAIEDRRRAICP